MHFDELAKHLSGEYFLKIPEKSFTNEFSQRLTAALKAHPGKFGVHLSIESDKYKSLNLHPRLLKIFPAPEVLKLLKDMEGVSQRISLSFN